MKIVRECASTMLMNKKSGALVLIDIQEKLTPHVMHAEKLVARCEWLIRLCHELTVPVIVCEQYPSGLGKTVEPLRTLANVSEPIEKVEFSCYQSELFVKQLASLHKQQIILAGIETHVCVLQTALDLKQQTQHDVFVVVDAVSCRSEMNNKYGLKRMKQAGVELVTSEMVFFEWLGRAGTPEFKTLSKSFMR